MKRNTKTLLCVLCAVAAVLCVAAACFMLTKKQGSTSASSAAIYCLQADKVFLTLAAGSENALSNGGTFTQIDDNEIDAVVYAKTDLTLN